MVALAPAALVFLIIAVIVTAIRTLNSNLSGTRCADWYSCILTQTLAFALFVSVAAAYGMFLNWVHAQGYVMVAWIMSGVGIWLSLSLLTSKSRDAFRARRV